MPDQPRDQGMSTTSGAIQWLIEGLSANPCILLHENHGLRYIYSRLLPMFFVPLFVILYFGQHPTDANHPGPLLFFMLLSFVAASSKHRQTKRQHAAGLVQHSHYNGKPVLMQKLGLTDEVKYKRVYEPLLLTAFALVIATFNHPLAAYLILCAIALAVSVWSSGWQQQQREIDLRDAYIEGHQFTPFRR